MEFELKEIRERPLIFFVFVAIFVHVAAGFVVYNRLQTDYGQKLISQVIEIKGVNPTPHLTPENKPPDKSLSEGFIEDGSLITDIPETESGSTAPESEPPEKTETTEEVLPPFVQSPLTSSMIQDSTFIHEKSGLLFVDEIIVPDNSKEQPVRKKIIPPRIHRDFTMSTLPREYRSRTWSLTLRLKVNKDGDPVGRIRVVKSSGDAIVDELTRSKVAESRFEPAHYEDSEGFFDYTFDLDIMYE